MRRLGRALPWAAVPASPRPALFAERRLGARSRSRKAGFPVAYRLQVVLDPVEAAVDKVLGGTHQSSRTLCRCRSSIPSQNRQ